MTREEVQDILAVIQSIYTNFKPVSKTAAVNAWLFALKEYEKNEVSAALNVFIKTNTSGFAPIPSQLIEIIAELKNPEQLGELEAWGLVRKAIKNSAYGYNEEFDKLPEVIQRALGNPSTLRAWAIDEEFNENVVSSNFMRSYKNAIERERFERKIPIAIREKVMNLIEGRN